MRGHIRVNGVARFEALDALRGVCALLVVLFHIPIYHALKGTQPFVNLQFCVDMFFALSGFVLCHAYGDRLRQGADGIRFAITRFARLWPLHVAVLVLLAGIEIVKLVFVRGGGSFSLDSVPFGEGRTPWEALTNILFLQSFNLHPGLTWNGPAWSAALEFYVSLLFAAVVIVFPRWRRPIFLGLCLAAGAMLYTLSPNSLFVSSDWGILRAMFSFFTGCLVYDLRLQSNGKLDTPHLLEVFSILLVVLFLLTTPKGGFQYVFPLLAAIVIYVFSFDQGFLSTLMHSKPLQMLGLWSYSIYMIHTFLFQVMRMVGSYLSHKLHLDMMIWYDDDKLLQLGSPGIALVPALVLSVVLVVPLAAVTYYWIERPAMEFGRRLTGSRGRSVAAPALRASAPRAASI
ncbi:MAG: hypothetical protein V7632_5050 [Bradyrhizobium sp.]|jgi:peptidoglycan/LPS O-acetylase OafA/YrhL